MCFSLKFVFLFFKTSITYHTQTQKPQEYSPGKIRIWIILIFSFHNYKMKIIDPNLFPSSIPILEVRTNSWGLKCFHPHNVSIQPSSLIQLIKHSFNKHMSACTVHCAKSKWYNFEQYTMSPTLMEDIS